MKWSIHQLNKLRNKGLTLDEMVDVSELKEVEKDIREINPVHVTGRVDLAPVVYVPSTYNWKHGFTMFSLFSRCDITI